MKRPIALVLAACLTSCRATPEPSPTSPDPAAATDPVPVAEQAAPTDDAPADSAPQAAAADTPAAASVVTSEAAPDPDPAPAGNDALPDLSDWFRATGHQGVHTLYWRPADGGEVPRNREFELDVVVQRDGQPADVQLQVTGWMPAHSHGLVQMPSVESVGDGRYLVRGMLLHMRGDWQVRFSIIANRSLETATFELTL